MTVLYSCLERKQYIMEDMSSFEVIPPTRRQLLIMLISSIIGCVCAIAGLTYAIAQGFHWLEGSSFSDNIFGALFCIGVMMIAIAFILSCPRIRRIQ